GDRIGDRIGAFSDKTDAIRTAYTDNQQRLENELSEHSAALSGVLDAGGKRFEDLVGGLTGRIEGRLTDANTRLGGLADEAAARIEGG
ncbi:hypothetical protein AB9F41_35225, partial [Rhizobium leguminosarum]|uniref:hypothetical protein n=1 Tax=Rhizobium leguminosarum TaxID=384 RepID=UPI003F975002